jgi:hypothetical protein
MIRIDSISVAEHNPRGQVSLERLTYPIASRYPGLCKLLRRS